MIARARPGTSQQLATAGVFSPAGCEPGGDGGVIGGLEEAFLCAGKASFGIEFAERRNTLAMLFLISGSREDACISSSGVCPSLPSLFLMFGSAP
jgi:hypothetical protein